MCASRPIRISGAAVLGFLLALSGCVSPSKPQPGVTVKAEALSHFSLGLLAEAGGDSPAALDHFKAAVRLDPDEELPYAPAVAIALKLERPDEAVRLARELQKRRADSAEPVLLIAKIYALTGNSDQAEKLFKQALSEYPEHPDIPVSLARFYLSQERRNDAFETLRSAAAIQKTNAEVLQLTGLLCLDNAGKMNDPQQADTAARKGIGFLRQALELAPENAVVWQQLGLALSAVKCPEDALKAFREAHRYAPADMVPARQLFDLLIMTGCYEEAVAIYEQLAAETGTDPEPWLQYLSEKIPEKEYIRLAEYLEKTVRGQPQAPVFYYAQLGTLYIGAGEFQKAEVLLSKALEHYPDDNRLRIVLGYLYLKQERYEGAYTELNRVRTAAQESEWSANPFFVFNFLISAQKSGHLKEAAETLASTYTADPAIMNQYIHTLLTEQTPVPPENAAELLNIFHTLNPKAAEALYYLMVLQAGQKQYEKAIESARQFETLAKETGKTNLLSGQFYYQYASLHERTGQIESAEKLFFKVIESGGEAAPAAQNYIAYMWADRGEKLDESLELVQKALVSDPGNGAYLDTLGWIYYMQGRYTEALHALQKALKIIENDPTIWEHMGDTYQKLGNRTAAVEHWKKALELEPGSQKLIDRLDDRPVRQDEDPVSADSRAKTMPRP